MNFIDDKMFFFHQHSQAVFTFKEERFMIYPELSMSYLKFRLRSVNGMM